MLSENTKTNEIYIWGCLGGNGAFLSPCKPSNESDVEQVYTFDSVDDFLDAFCNVRTNLYYGKDSDGNRIPYSGTLKELRVKTTLDKLNMFKNMIKAGKSIEYISNVLLSEEDMMNRYLLAYQEYLLVVTRDADFINYITKNNKLITSVKSVRKPEHKVEIIYGSESEQDNYGVQTFRTESVLSEYWFTAEQLMAFTADELRKELAIKLVEAYINIDIQEQTW